MGGEWASLSAHELVAAGILEIGDGYRAKNEELSNTGVPFARAANLNNGFDFRDADHFPLDRLAAVGAKVSQPGDVAFTSKGTVGRFAYVSSDVERFVYSPQLCYWRSKDLRQILPRFLYYYMCGPAFAAQMRSVSGQTDMAEYVSLSDQRRFAIILPPLSVQHAIADLLGALDDRIELNRRMAETLEAQARALFRSWFVDFDPVRARAEGRPTSLPNALAALFPTRLADDGLPEGWKWRPLSSIGRFLNGLALQKYAPDDDAASLPVIKIVELRAGPTAKSGRARADLPAEYIVNDGDHLFSWSGSLTHVRWSHGPGALNQHLFKVTPLDVPAWLTFQAVEEHLAEFQAIASGKAVTMGHIQRHHLDEAMVAMPCASLLSAADDVMTPIHHRVLGLALQSRTLTALRDTLLPKLTSGELRIRDAERAVAAA